MPLVGKMRYLMGKGGGEGMERSHTRNHRSGRLLGLGLAALAACSVSPRAEHRMPLRATAMLQFINPQSVAQASTMTSPLLFDAVSDFAEGVAMVRIKSTLGYIDRSGNLIIQVADSSVTVAADYAEGLAIAQAGAYVGYLDRQGEWAIPVQFRKAKTFSGGAGGGAGGHQIRLHQHRGRMGDRAPV